MGAGILIMSRVYQTCESARISALSLQLAQRLLCLTRPKPANRMMKYAMRLYGDNAAGILVDDTGEDDIERQMIQQALEGFWREPKGL